MKLFNSKTRQNAYQHIQHDCLNANFSYCTLLQLVIQVHNLSHIMLNIRLKTNFILKINLR